MRCLESAAKKTQPQSVSEMLDAQTLFKFFLNESVENRLHCLYYSVNLHMFRVSIKPISVYFHYLPFIKVKKGSLLKSFLLCLCACQRNVMELLFLFFMI